MICTGEGGVKKNSLALEELHACAGKSHTIKTTLRLETNNSLFNTFYIFKVPEDGLILTEACIYIGYLGYMI
jgi:hypothetical protein